MSEMREGNTPALKPPFSIGGLFRNDRFVAVFSIAVAVLIWFSVSVAFNPTTEKTVLQVPVQIPLSGTVHEDLKAYDGSDTTVSVAVQGKKYIVDPLAAEDLVVTANLSNVVGVGTYQLDLSAKSATGSDEYEVLSISPSSISVTFDNEATKTLDIEVKCPGLTADVSHDSESMVVVDTQIADEAHTTLTVVGAASAVNRIDYAVATSDVTEVLTQSKRVTAHIALYSAYDELLYDSTSPDSAAIKLTQLQFTEVPVIARVNMIRDLPLVVNYRNAPEKMPSVILREAGNTDSESVTSIRVEGAIETVSAMKEIALDGHFDFASLDPSDPSKWYKDLTLPVLSGISYFNYSNLKEVTFRVSLSPDEISVKSFDLPRTSVSVANTSYTVTVESDLNGIWAAGPARALRNLTADGILVSVDAQGLEPGTYTLKPTFQIPSQKQCWVMGDYEVTVRVS